jgi:hypothetical protein
MSPTNTSKKPLDNLARINKLHHQPPSAREFDGLLQSGSKRLDDARRRELSIESQFDLAYNAAHSLALAALRWHGFRSDSRFLVFQCLQHTVDLSANDWRILDQAHRKRNLAEYEGHLEVDQALIDATIRVAEKVLNRLSELEPPAS